MKNDKYSQARSGRSRILDITCENCNIHLCYYQKDGPGPLKRMYVDRMVDIKPATPKLECGNCGSELGLRIIYAKENRPAYRLFQSSINKRIVKQAAAK
jgi:ribosomal protein S27E